MGPSPLFGKTLAIWANNYLVGFRISGADVQLDPVDPRRFDISIGNGQRFSVRAQNEQERQSWIIALAATKQKSNEIGGLKSTIKRSDKSEKVARKSTELKLFCDLLKQQTSDLQDSLVIDCEKDEKLDPQALNEKTKMLSATCDTFLKTLNDTMKLFEDAKNSISSPPMSPKSERKGFRRTPSTTSLPVSYHLIRAFSSWKIRLDWTPEPQFA